VGPALAGVVRLRLARPLDPAHAALKRSSQWRWAANWAPVLGPRRRAACRTFATLILATLLVAVSRAVTPQ
jgi:hypothetical protein